MVKELSLDDCRGGFVLLYALSNDKLNERTSN